MNRFLSSNARTWAPVNLDRLQAWINQGRLTSTPASPITARELLLSGCVHNAHDGIKLLGDGATQLKTPVHIIASRASKSAIAAIESTGGSVFCKHYNSLALRDCIKGETSRLSAAPTRKTDIRTTNSLYDHEMHLTPFNSLVYQMGESRLFVSESCQDYAHGYYGGSLARIIQTA